MNHYNMDKSRLYVYQCRADRGPYSKRMRPVSKGQAHPYRRRSTHLTIVVREMTDAEMAAAPSNLRRGFRHAANGQKSGDGAFQTKR
ncbi:unnamed protein product [Effrenium voratum]|nr:unnamed protein product [Effrenium voratum]